MDLPPLFYIDSTSNYDIAAATEDLISEITGQITNSDVVKKTKLAQKRKKSYRCDFCDSQYNEAGKYKSHLSKIHQEILREKISNQLIDISNNATIELGQLGEQEVWICRKCKKVSFSSEAYDRHICQFDSTTSAFSCQCEYTTKGHKLTFNPKTPVEQTALKMHYLLTHQDELKKIRQEEGTLFKKYTKHTLIEIPKHLFGCRFLYECNNCNIVIFNKFSNRHPCYREKQKKRRYRR